MAELSRDALKRLALLGAKARLAELREEEAAIRRTFPELFRGNRAAAPATQRAGGRRGMTAAGRKAVSERMKKYWAERRKAKNAK